jgi:hypothetical protein
MATQLEFGKTKVILLSGRAGVGKTTTANMLKELFENQGKSADIFPFARGVKIVAKLMGWDGIKDDKGRELLIGVGNVARAYNENVWARINVEEIIEGHPKYPLDIVLIDDWRFPNEGKYIEENPLYQVFRVRIHSPNRESLLGTKYYFDVSETSLPEYEEGFYFYDLDNRGTLEDLNESAKFLAELIYK